MFRFGILVFVPFFVNSAAMNDNDNCPTSAFEKEIQQLQKTSAKMDIFLKQNMDNGIQTLKKVLTDFGYDGDELLIEDLEAPLESFLLRYQMASHRELKQMISDLQESVEFLVSSRTSPKVKSLKTDVASSPEPSDCSDILKDGKDKTGVYRIYPFRQSRDSLKAFCDMETDGGGWTVFLTRMKQDKQLNFTRNWQEYKKGFGSAKAEYWLGNDVLHALTKDKYYTLRIESKGEDDDEIWGEWNTFRVDSEEMKYKLTAEGYNPKSSSTNVSLSYHHGMSFSTYEQDNDHWTTVNCAFVGNGGWWFNNCVAVNPTGVYGIKAPHGLAFSNWSRKDPSLRYAKWLQMKIRPTV